MTKDEAIHKALKVLNCLNNDRVYETAWVKGAINACKEALEQPAQTYIVNNTAGTQFQLHEQPAQEPVYAIVYDGHIQCDMDTGLLEIYNSKEEAEDNTFIGAEIKAIDIYTHPHQWQGLTDDEIWEVKGFYDYMTPEEYIAAVRNVEAKIKEKNT